MLKIIQGLRESNKLLKALILAGLLILVIIIFAQKIEFSSVDLGRHLENGRLVFENKDVLFKNFYSYTEPEMEFINHHWLAGVIFYAVYLLGGFKFLSIFNILLALFTFLIFFKLAQKKAGFLIPTVLSIPVIFLFSERVEVRPEIFSYLFLALTWFILESKNLSKKKRLIFLLSLFVLWSNIHIYFFLGLALVFFKLFNVYVAQLLLQVGEWKNKLRLAFLAVKPKFIEFCLLILACLLTPNHIWGLLYPLNIFKNYGYQVAENKSIFFLADLMLNYNFQIFKLVLILLIISFISAWLFTKKINWFNLLFGLFIAVLALFASRNLALFGLVALVLISAGIRPAAVFLKDRLAIFYTQFVRLSGKSVLLIFNREKYFLLLILVLIFFFGLFLISDYFGRHSFLKREFGLGLSTGSFDSFQFFKEGGLTGPIFNNYDAGSALIFGLAGKEKVFVDNRPEAYSSAFFTETYLPIQNDEEQWKNNLDKYKFKTIYFSHTDSTPWGRAFLIKILQNQDWSLVYFDNYFVILASKANTPKEILEKYTINSWIFRDKLRALANNSDLKSQFYLADLAQSFGANDLAEEIYRQIIITRPHNKKVILSLAYLYSASADRNSLFKAINYFEQTLKAEKKTPGIYNQLALIYWQLGEYKQAEYYWLQAKKNNRKDANAVYYLNQIEDLKKRGDLPLD